MLQAHFYSQRLRFKFAAGTSRGVLTEKDSYFIALYDTENPEVWGVGEASPLPKLSPDDSPELNANIAQICTQINESGFHLSSEAWAAIIDFFQYCTQTLPSVRFALETALYDLMYGGVRKIEDNDFWKGTLEIPINGLIWMDKAERMKAQIEQKLAEGFTCLKMKIGAIDFEQEYELLKNIRQRYSAADITLRVDANGAFSPQHAPHILERLAALHIHSIEQPIKAGQQEAMQRLCAATPLPIALDEELIGISTHEQKQDLLRFIRPQYIILKPTLVGGLAESAAWIEVAENQQIAWWNTSALESNIGLNAICQFTARYPISLPQGLGTGQLYENNISAPLTVRKGKIYYDTQQQWHWLAPKIFDTTYPQA